jgi:hypothetical protein
MKVMMTQPLKPYTAIKKRENVYNRSLTAPVTFVLLSLLAASANAQIVTPTAPRSAVSSPAAFPQIALSKPLRPANAPATASTSADLALPEDPSAHTAVSDTTGLQNSGTPQSATTAGPVASLHTKYIPAGWAAQHITARDKVMIGIQDLYSPLSFAAIIASAGYEQVLNGEPNYGVDRGAFGQRLGAAGIRETTQGFFTDSVFAPLLHEDPRYYVEGAQYGFFHRTVYAVTRPMLTRTDSGHRTVNAALLFGYAASSALSYSYYPQVNRNAKDTASTFGGALGGAAVGFFVSEFSSDLLVKLHLKKSE